MSGDSLISIIPPVATTNNKIETRILIFNLYRIPHPKTMLKYNAIRK